MLLSGAAGTVVVRLQHIRAVNQLFWQPGNCLQATKSVAAGVHMCACCCWLTAKAFACRTFCGAVAAQAFKI